MKIFLIQEYIIEAVGERALSSNGEKVGKNQILANEWSPREFVMQINTQEVKMNERHVMEEKGENTLTGYGMTVIVKDKQKK